MKKLVKFAILTILLFTFINKVSALSVSKDSLTIDKGEKDSIELYANSEKEITSVEFTLVYSSYDVAANFIVNSSYTDGNPNGITHKVDLVEAKSGKILLGNVSINVKNNAVVKSGSINIHSAKGYTSDGEIVSLNSQIINVTVGKKENIEEKKEEIDKNLLDKIESKIVKIGLKKDVFEYTVSISKDVKELDLKAIPKSDSTKVEISSQKIENIKDNKIIITAINGDVKQEYTINLKEKKNKDLEVTIDKGEFKEDSSYKGKWILISIVSVMGLMGGLILIKKK